VFLFRTIVLHSVVVLTWAGWAGPDGIEAQSFGVIFL